MITVPEKYCQKLCGMVMSKVDALRSKVKTMTDTESELMTVIERRDRPRWPGSVVPITIGSKGKIHGASTVRKPASTDIKKKTM